MINWQQIDLVLLDMDGTLLDLHFDNYFWHEYLPLFWAEKKGLEYQAAKNELIPRINSIRGTLKWYCLDHWSAELQINLIEIKQAVKHKIRYRADSKQFLHFLRRSGKELVMVTNAHRDLIQMKFDALELEPFFHHVISSHDFGFAKEEMSFWSTLEERVPLNKERLVLFDDNLAVLKTAQEFGIKHLVSIVNPDSQKPDREINEFKAICDFQELY